MMYEYKFIQIELKQGLMKATAKEDYREIIKEEGKNGWRLVQIFAPSVVGYGSAENFELIFEKVNNKSSLKCQQNQKMHTPVLNLTPSRYFISRTGVSLL